MTQEAYDYAFSHVTLNKAIDSLSLKQFFRQSKTQGSLNNELTEELSERELNKAAFLASILACSENEEHQQKAMSFAILAYLEKRNVPFASYCYVILSRVDNIQQGKHLPEILENQKFRLHYDEALNLELSAKRALASLQLPNLEPIYLTRFQKDLWAQLQKTSRVIAVSGPTSSGKSFMVQNHIIEVCKARSSFRAVYIVPTRALIAEVSSELRNRLANDGVSIRVAVGQAEEVLDREVFVLTPERCLQLLRDSNSQRQIDLIFMDEIQKIEDTERGVIFEHVLNDLAGSQKSAKIVVPGPYLKNLEKTVARLTGLNGEPVESHLSPVYQLKTIFTLSPSNEYGAEVTIKNSSASQISAYIHSGLPLYKMFMRESKSAIAAFVKCLGKIAPTSYMLQLGHMLKSMP
jgi:DNA replication protein DnaC